MTESMRWSGFDHGTSAPTEHSAQQIVAWVNANGGEARQEYQYTPPQWNLPAMPLIAVLTREGWEHCSPGQWVVMGEWFEESLTGVQQANAAHFMRRLTRRVREFTVRDTG